MIIEISIDDLSDRYSNTLHAYETEKDITKLPLYDKIKQYRSSKRLDWKSASDKDIYNNVSDFIKLYKKIKKNGYTDNPYIKITVEKNGAWKLHGGYHRVSILKYLKCKTVNANITMDPEFKKFYGYVSSMYKAYRAYEYINHLVFSNYNFVRGNNRSELIKDHIDIDAPTILDIGSYFGEIALSLSSIPGSKVVGIDTNKGHVNATNYITLFPHYKDRKVSFYQGDIVDYNPSQFDVIVMLSVDRWVMKSHGRSGLKAVIKKIESKCKRYFFFESRGKHEELALKLIHRYTNFTNQTLCGVDNGETNRRIWRFEIKEIIHVGEK